MTGPEDLGKIFSRRERDSKKSPTADAVGEVF